MMKSVSALMVTLLLALTTGCINHSSTETQLACLLEVKKVENNSDGYLVSAVIYDECRGNLLDSVHTNT